jgi:hypothetical protein
MARIGKVRPSVLACCLLLAVLAGCASSAGAPGAAGQIDHTQQYLAMEGALGSCSCYISDGPVMGNKAFPVGTDQSVIGQIDADSPQTITLIAATLIPLPGFRTPALVSTGVIAGHCLPSAIVLLPAPPGGPSPVLVGGRSYQPLPLRGYTMQIGAGCVPQLIYVVRATAAGQYAVGGLRVLVSYEGSTQTMFAYYGVDIWYYGAGPLPSARQVTYGQRAAFAAQLALWRRNGH